MSSGFFDTRLRFTGDGPAFDASLHEVLLVVGAAREVGTLTYGVKLGGIVAGELAAKGQTYAIEPGLVVGVSLDWRVLSAPRDAVSLTLGLQLGVAWSSVAPEVGAGPLDDRWLTFDARASATVSRTFFGRLTPYASVRLFGGPALWGGAAGGDKTHVQLAAGLALAVTDALSLHVEGALLAERGAFAGLGLAF
ncbi:MAG: hypothetical protein U1F43_14960 [Myxococcota bacterium]